VPAGVVVPSGRAQTSRGPTCRMVRRLVRPAHLSSPLWYGRSDEVLVSTLDACSDKGLLSCARLLSNHLEFHDIALI
jgi:hypothetical protein